jgi:hypothetical protein
MRLRNLIMGTCLAFAGLLGALAPAAVAVPGEQGAAVEVVEPGPAPVALKTGSDGRSYWELTVKGGGAYIASWERSSGIWATPEDAGAALTGMYDCRSKAVLKYVNQFPTYEAFSNAPGVKYGEGTGMTFTDPATVKTMAACLKDSFISSDQVDYVKEKATSGKTPGSVVIQIPAALTGPGTHELFIAKYALLASGNPACPRKTWAPGPDSMGGAIGGMCNPGLKDIKKFTVTIPREASATVLGGPAAEAGTWFEPSSYSNFRPLDVPASSGTGAAMAAALWPAAVPAMVLGVGLALLVAAPTVLLSAAGGRSTGRLARVVDSVVPASAPPGGGVSGPGSWRTSLLGQVHGPLAFLILVACSALAAAGQRGFGWNEASARMVLSFLAAFLVLNYGSMVFRWGIARRRRRGCFPRVAARPVYVAVLLASLAFSRLVGLEPAVVFGAVLSIDYSLNTREAGPRRLALAALAGSFYLAAVGLAAWAGYSFLASNHVEKFIRWNEIQPDSVAVVSDAAGYATVAAGELLAVIATVAIAALPVTLLPLAPFEGALVWAWHRTAWVLTYSAAVAVFSFVLLPWSGSMGDGEAPFYAWLGLYAGYVVLAGVLWVVLVRRGRGRALPFPDPSKSATPAPKVVAGVVG